MNLSSCKYLLIAIISHEHHFMVFSFRKFIALHFSSHKTGEGDSKELKNRYYAGVLESNCLIVFT